MSTPKNKPSQVGADEAVYIGIDYHKRYSVYHVLDGRGETLGEGRIEHARAQDFVELAKRWANPRVVFEASMNWHWLYEELEKHMPCEHITLANPFKTRIIAEAQVKTDKIDARILSLLLRADLVCAVHIPAKETRERKEVLRQRCFFVGQRTRVRNRIHRLLGGQHGLELPQLSDLFGRQGMSFLRKLELPAPAGLLLTQQLDLLEELQVRIAEDEKALKAMMNTSPQLRLLLGIPGVGPIFAAVILNEIDDISRFHTSQKLCGYCGLCPTTTSSGGKTYNGKLMRHCNKWLRWAFVEAAWAAIRVNGSLGELYKRKRAAGKKANTAILCVARRLARITWQILTHEREFTIFPPTQTNQGQPAPGQPASAGSAKGGVSQAGRQTRRAPAKPRQLSPAAP